MADFVEKLKNALKPATPSALAGTLIHDHEVAILKGATQLLDQSESGRELLEFARNNGIAVHVLRNKENFGVLINDSTVYISCPAGQVLSPVKAAIYLTGALRQAQQEGLDGLKRPKTAQMPKDQFVKIFIDKDKDVLWYQSAVVYELSKVNGLSEIVDEFARMGYLSLYKSYQEDMKSQGLEDGST